MINKRLFFWVSASVLAILALWLVGDRYLGLDNTVVGSVIAVPIRILALPATLCMVLHNMACRMSGAPLIGPGRLPVFLLGLALSALTWGFIVERAARMLAVAGEKWASPRSVFWRRLAATWVDSFVIYALAAFLVELAAVARIRIATEPLCVVVGAVYGTVMLTRWGQTIGKMLLGIAVTIKDGADPTLRNVLLREALGKWGILFVAPVALGRALVGQAWIPTVYDVLIVLPVLLLLLVHYAIVRRTWYDLLGGTVVQRVSGFRGRARPAFVALMAAAVLGLGAKATMFAVQGRLPCRLALFRSMRSTAPYVAFLKQGHATPVDYVIGLFDRYDVVVLCERDHREMTQYDFILDVLRDPRFGDRVGHVFSEVGNVAMQSHLDEFMATDGLSPPEIHQRVVHITRNCAVFPFWEKTNFYTYFSRLYELNQSLPRARRIRHHLTDGPVNWAEVTTQDKFQAYRRSLVNRDQTMAQTVIDEMARLTESQRKPAKCLVVMNYRHAFDLTGRSPQATRMNTYEYLRDAFDGRAANVLLGAYYVFAPIAGGVWDAAFAEAGDPPIGFDLEGTPFGQDAFDYFPFIPAVKGRLRYRDVFTGFVYAQPLDKQYVQVGVPGQFTGYAEEAVRLFGLEWGDKEARRFVASEIDDEQAGRVPRRQGLPGFAVGSQLLLELGPLALTGIGLLIGLISFGLGRWRHRSQQAG